MNSYTLKLNGLRYLIDGLEQEHTHTHTAALLLLIQMASRVLVRMLLVVFLSVITFWLCRRCHIWFSSQYLSTVRKKKKITIARENDNSAFVLVFVFIHTCIAHIVCKNFLLPPPHSNGTMFVSFVSATKTKVVMSKLDIRNVNNWRLRSDHHFSVGFRFAQQKQQIAFNADFLISLSLFDQKQIKTLDFCDFYPF